MPNPRKEPRYCSICGRHLIGGYYSTGRCAYHQTTKDADRKIGRDAVAAKSRGLSYGQYMAAKEAGKV